MIDSDWLTDLRRLHEAGTAAPWYYDAARRFVTTTDPGDEHAPRWRDDITGEHEHGDAAGEAAYRLIAAMRTAAPRLLAIAEAAAAAVDSVDATSLPGVRSASGASMRALAAAVRGNRGGDGNG